LLQNLVVTPVKGAGKRYRIISGERRYRALKLLQERGALSGDFSVAAEIRKNLSKDEGLRLATVENLQRQDLTPLEEAAALTKLIRKGDRLDDVAAQTGLSVTTIRRRLALNDPCAEAKVALAEGDLSLSQAEALTLGSHEAQSNLLDVIRRGHETVGADDMRRHWRPDRAFLERRNKDQLLTIAEDCGCATRYGIGLLRSYKKSELVGCLLRHFDLAQTNGEDGEEWQKARDWLPEAMQFPSINPDAEAGDDDTDADEPDDAMTGDDEAPMEEAA